MKLSDWYLHYNSTLRTILHRMEPKVQEVLRDDMNGLIRVLHLFNSFEKELFKKYHKGNKPKFTIRYKELDYLCKKYIRICRSENNYFGGYIFFILLEDLKQYFKVEYSKYRYDDITSFTRKATKKEREYAEKTFPHDKMEYGIFSFLDPNEEISILDYKGLKIYVREKYNQGFMVDWLGNVQVYGLVLDWWFPIDEYLYLSKGWKLNLSEKYILF